MQELEKILEEIDLEEKNALLSVEHTTGYKAGALNMANTIRDIIRKHMNDGWTPADERLPEDGTYICTLDGELCGLEEPFTGMCGIEKGIWDEPDCVIAWRPLPEPYKPKQPETCKYTGGSCCWPVDQCGECPNNPERSENDQ